MNKQADSIADTSFTSHFSSMLLTNKSFFFLMYLIRLMCGGVLLLYLCSQVWCGDRGPAQSLGTFIETF